MKIGDSLVQDVMELGRDSPADDPNMLLVTVDELQIIAERHLEFYEGLLLLVLYHHQGGNSPVGQPIRQALGLQQFENISDDHMDKIRRSLAALEA